VSWTAPSRSGRGLEQRARRETGDRAGTGGRAAPGAGRRTGSDRGPVSAPPFVGRLVVVFGFWVSRSTSPSTPSWLRHHAARQARGAAAKPGAGHRARLPSAVSPARPVQPLFIDRVERKYSVVGGAAGLRAGVCAAGAGELAGDGHRGELPYLDGIFLAIIPAYAYTAEGVPDPGPRLGDGGRRRPRARRRARYSPSWWSRCSPRPVHRSVFWLLGVVSMAALLVDARRAAHQPPPAHRAGPVNRRGRDPQRHPGAAAPALDRGPGRLERPPASCPAGPIDNLKRFGFAGPILPVNPTRRQVQGLPAYPDLDHVVGDIDLAMIMLAAELVPDAVRACGKRGVPAAIVGAAGIR